MGKKTVPIPVVAQPVVSSPSDQSDDSEDSDTTSNNMHNFIFVNSFNASVNVSVVTNLTQKPQVITIYPNKEGTITGECLYYVKVSSGKFETVIIPGLGVVNDTSSIMLTDKHKLCSSSKFQIKSSPTKAGLSLTNYGI